ncbi:MAG: hypothetical protein JW772_01770 [Candidatus Diapherotrites archaeon]|nr:hypothetical protein [Candidatus Diapherotrites archaeon]
MSTYNCPECGKGFETPVDGAFDEKTNALTVSCPFCKHRYTVKTKTIKSETQLKCPKCKKTFEDGLDTVYGSSESSTTCPFCKTRFSLNEKTLVKK